MNIIQGRGGKGPEITDLLLKSRPWPLGGCTQFRGQSPKQVITVVKIRAVIEPVAKDCGS